MGPSHLVSVPFSLLKVLDEDVHHLDVFLRLGDVHVAFEIFLVFCSKIFLFILPLPPFFGFLKLAYHF
jgi:hypothetical protein